MGGEDEGWGPSGSPLYIPKDDHWTHFDNSVNAVSFGFVATAILISMFLVMAIFEKFLRATTPPPPIPPSSAVSDRRPPVQIGGGAAAAFSSKLGYPSPKISMNAKEVSVLMPGNTVPTFIAHPAPVSTFVAHLAPVPCPPERMQWPSHQHVPSTST